MFQPCRQRGAPPSFHASKVSFGSTSEVPAREWEVRFALNHGHRQPDLSGPKSANRRNPGNSAQVRNEAKPGDNEIAFAKMFRFEATRPVCELVFCTALLVAPSVRPCSAPDVRA